MRRLNRFAALLLVIVAVCSASSVCAAAKKAKAKTEEVKAAPGMVVITAKGKKYHNPGCGTVKKTHKILSVQEARSKGYTPCRVCGTE